MTALYNDHDPKVCDWLEELIRRGLLPAGVVDRRSILDVRPADLAGFTQCHFFAGIGGWPYALRLAGWPDDRPVWTGSPPCQPFSAAGARKGKDDARHLAPHFADLIAAGGPPVLFGEQVASSEVFGKAASGARKRASATPGWAWIDDLFARLEAAHYACGAGDIPSSSVGAPHIRQRCFFGAVDLDWLADAGGAGLSQQQRRRIEPERPTASGMAGGLDDAPGARHAREGRWEQGEPKGRRCVPELGCENGWLADADGRHPRAEGLQRGGQHRQQSQDGGLGGVADAALGGRELRDSGGRGEGVSAGARGRRVEAGRGCSPDFAGGTHADHGPWGNPDWLHCRDGKWRPVESGTFPLAHGLPARMVRLRGYGNAINPWLAAEFVQAFCEAVGICDADGWRVTEPPREIGTLFDWAAE